MHCGERWSDLSGNSFLHLMCVRTKVLFVDVDENVMIENENSND